MGKGNRNKSRKKAVVAPDLPQHATTDFDDPDDFAVWAFAGLPHMKGAPLGLPVWLLRKISRRLWDCGFRHHEELRTIKYRPPHAGMGIAMFSAAGEWVPIGDPDPVESVDDAAVTAARSVIDQLGPAQKEQLVNALGLDTRTSTDDGLVPYRRADGSTMMVTPARARAWRNARKAAGRGPGTTT